MLRRSVKILLCMAMLLLQLDWVAGYRHAFAAPAAAPKLVAGYYHTASLVSSGEVYSWGYGDRGQLGNGTWSARTTPVMAKGLNHVIDVHTGVRSTMALRSDGTVWTWGSNENGQLGIGTVTDMNVPGQVSGLSGIKAVSGGLGYHSMALSEDGSVWTWGKNDNGELGNGTTLQQNTPVQVAGLNDVTAIAAGGYFSLALKSDGTVWAWGVNGDGELGDGTTTDRYVPVQVAGLTDVMAIAAGGSHSLAVTQDGTVWAWGKNTYGTLGDGTRTNRTRPVQIKNLQHIVAVAGGGYHSLALDRTGNVWSWGDNSQRQLGVGSNASSLIPVPVSGIEHVREIAAGGFHSVAMKKDGTVWGWGFNGGGQLGDGTSSTRDTPTLTKAVLDTTPPDPGSGTLNPDSITTDSVALQWPKAVDNMTEQHELQYLLYSSGSPNIGDVSQMEKNGKPVGSYATDQTALVVNGLSEGTDYYFNVIAKDAAGRKSSYRMVKVTTKWPNLYSLTYDGNGHTAGNVPVSSGLFARGDETLVADNTGQLRKDEFVFEGWNTEPDGSGSDYPAGSKLTFGTQDVTLYAKWKPLPSPTELRALSYTPSHHSVGVEKDVPLRVVFQEEVTAVSGRLITIRQSPDSHVVETIDAADAGRVTILGNTAIIDPLNDFDEGMAYYVEIDPGAFTGNLSGASFAGIQGADTWSFTVKEAAVPAYDASLQGLRFESSEGEVGLSPAFDRYHYDYKAAVPKETNRITVTAQVYDARATVAASVYGVAGDLVFGPIDLVSGQKSPDLPIAAGNHVIEVVVTAPDGQQQKYRAAVTEAASTGGGGTPEAPGGSAPDSGQGPALPSQSNHAAPSENRVKIRVTLNDESQEGMVAGLSHEINGHTVVSMKLDTAKLEARLKTVDYKPVIIIALDQPADQVSLEASGEAIDLLSAKQGAVEIRSTLGHFHVPAAVMASSRWHEPDNPKLPLAADQMSVTLKMAATDAAKAEAVKKALSESGAALVGSPVDFDITAKAKAHDKPLELKRFPQYMEHRITWPQGMPGRITTAVGVDDNGELYHIPTRVEPRKDGSVEAIMHRLDAGTVAFVAHQANLADVTFHWSNDAVNDLASRMILSGKGSSEDGAGAGSGADHATLHFAPNAQVNRAEFAAMIVRALGLPEVKGEGSAFQDVHAGDWYSGVIAQAVQYELIQGDAVGRFRPDQGITRQEAMAVMARAMKLAGLTTVMNKKEADIVLDGYRDLQDLSDWAKPAAAVLVNEGIVYGADDALKPLSKLTRGEAAAMLQRLLRAAQLID